MPAWLQAQVAAKQNAAQGTAAVEETELQAKLPAALRERLKKRGVLGSSGAAAATAPTPSAESAESAESKAATVAALQAKIQAGLAAAENAATNSVPPAAAGTGGGAGQWAYGTDPASGYPYWCNTLTGQSTWQQPAGWVPPMQQVCLSACLSLSCC